MLTHHGISCYGLYLSPAEDSSYSRMNELEEGLQEYEEEAEKLARELEDVQVGGLR